MGTYCGLWWIRQKFLRCNTKQYMKDHIDKLIFITVIKPLCFKIHCEENGKTIHRPENYSQIIFLAQDLCPEYTKNSYNSIM